MIDRRTGCFPRFLILFRFIRTYPELHEHAADAPHVIGRAEPAAVVLLLARVRRRSDAPAAARPGCADWAARPGEAEGPQRLGENGLRLLSLGGACAPAWRFSSCYLVAK